MNSKVVVESDQLKILGRRKVGSNVNSEPQLVLRTMEIELNNRVLRIICLLNLLSHLIKIDFNSEVCYVLTTQARTKHTFECLILFKFFNLGFVFILGLRSKYEQRGQPRLDGNIKL